MTNVLLATPTSDYTVTGGYARSVFGLAKLLGSKGVNVDMRTIRSSDIEIARNRFATRFLKEGYSHLLFVDEDMEFAAEDIAACIEFDKPVVGIACVRKDIDLTALVGFLHKNKLEPTPANVEAAMACVSTFNVDLEPMAGGKARQIKIERGFISVQRVGTGIMLIKREVFTRMIEAKCVELWRNRQLDEEAIYKDGIYGFFSKVKAAENLLSEDFSFCQRWTGACGGAIWCKIDSAVKHLGVFGFTGRYLDRLKHNMI